MKCPGWGSPVRSEVEGNPHGPCGPRHFKSLKARGFLAAGPRNDCGKFLHVGLGSALDALRVFFSSFVWLHSLIISPAFTELQTASKQGAWQTDCSRERIGVGPAKRTVWMPRGVSRRSRDMQRLK